MKNYYVVIIKQDSQSINAYETIDSALGAFHTEMAYAYNSNIDTTCIVTDRFGSQNKVERYTSTAEQSNATNDTEPLAHDGAQIR